MIMPTKPVDVKRHYPSDIQDLITKRSKVFEDLPPGRPPNRRSEHIIELEEGEKLVITTSYWYPKKQKYEIEKAIKELLDMGFIRPSKSPFASIVLLVRKKDGTMRMCVDYQCDASREVFGVVLMQEKHPIAFERRKLRGAENSYSIYDKEMLAIMHALAKFRQYLVGSKFVAKIDHNSLKHFMHEKYLNERQQKWVSKLQAYDFDI
ncbi:uncharacterized protein LOC131874243 [Cryptomeria japonica]|uniref:uncharacterized protein LOC131874243 n=1 Tax=Cryptomeria japonica TaxID=3369 RepID=UPI0027DA906E|nr:uncharacterized protein LOC131874243 [Cryptomeria japonica]